MEKVHGGDIYRHPVRLDFSINVNPLGMPEEVCAALHRAVEKCEAYPDIHAEKLAQAVSGSLGILKEHLLFGNGASELFLGIIHALKPKKILLPVPSFLGYEYAAGAVSGEMVYYVLKEEHSFLFQEDFFDFLTEDTDLLFLANPNNPTGKKMDRDYLIRVLDVCRKKQIFVVLDECFIEFCETVPSMLSWYREYDNLFLVRAFTKIFAIPGARLGYLVSGNRLFLENIRLQLPEWNLSSFAQEAGAACAGQMEYLKKTVEYVKKERCFLAGGLRKLGIRIFDGDANFLLVRTEIPLYQKLLEKGILIRNCENFRGLSKGYYRIAVKKRPENEILLKEAGECVGL